MDDREVLTHLRSIVYQGDGPGLVTALSEPWPADSLQLIGDGLLAAVSDGTGDAHEVARACANALGERSWEGDRELAEGPGSGCRRGPGEVWPQSAIEYAEEVGEIDEDDDDTERWLWVQGEGSHEGYLDTEWFIVHFDKAFANRLADAISGRGAFRRFKDRLSERPELMTWRHAFANDRRRGRAGSWLAGEGLTPARRTQ